MTNESTITRTFRKLETRAESVHTTGREMLVGWLAIAIRLSKHLVANQTGGSRREELS